MQMRLLKSCFMLDPNLELNHLRLHLKQVSTTKLNEFISLKHDTFEKVLVHEISLS